MSGSRWKDALWRLLDVFAVRRITAHVALSAGLLGLATQSAAEGGAQPRVPITPTLAPEATVRKFKGKYVLKRSASSFFIHLAGHRSHSSHPSHSSHRSHSSHSSGSHYSGTHYSSTAPAPRAPVVEQPPPPPPPRPPAPPQPLLRDEFDTTSMTERWRIGVLATPSSTFDSDIVTTQSGGTLRIAPRAGRDAASFSGYVSKAPFDLRTASIAVELRRPASGATTIFAAAIDSANWLGFRVADGQLSIDSHTAGRTASRKMPYDAVQHRYFRLRTSNVANVVVWETSADGVNWNPEYVETATIAIHALHIAMSAGTTKNAAAPGPAIFDSVLVKEK